MQYPATFKLFNCFNSTSSLCRTDEKSTNETHWIFLLEPKKLMAQTST